MKNIYPVIKRVYAYLIDITLVMILSFGISKIPFLEKDNEKYQEKYSQYEEKYNELKDFYEQLENSYEDIDLDELFSDDYSTAAQTTAYTAPVISFDAPDYVDIESTDDEYDPAPYIGGGVGDTAYGDTYNFTLTELSVYQNEFFPPSEGCVYMSFTLSLENTSDSSRLFYELPVVEANGKECNFAGFSGLFIPGELAPGEVYEKAVIYEVPADTVFLDIYYGDETAIYILGYDIEGFEPDFGYEYDGNDSQY